MKLEIASLRAACLSMVVWMVGGPVAVYAQRDIPQTIDAHVQPYLNHKIVVGLSVGVLMDGQVYTQGFGRVGGTSDEKPNEHSVYEIGSISKVFTAILLADQVAQGKVNLDDPIKKWFPQEFSSPHSTLDDVTFKYLATHESGLPRMPSNLDLSQNENPYASYDQKLLYDFLHSHLLMHKPGQHWEYSNLGFGLLGDLLASHNGKSYSDLLSQRITDPLGMADTSIGLSDDQKTRLAPGYMESLEPSHNWDFTALAGAGAIRSTVDDMLKFAQACLTPPDNDLGRAINLTWDEHRKPKKRGERAGGLGWMIAGDGETRFHNGQTGGYHSALFVGRDLNLAVIVLSNTATMEVDVLAEHLYQVMAGMDVKPREFEKSIDVPLDKMHLYAGKYELVPGVQFTVSIKDGSLFVGITGQPTFRVYPKTETEWAYKVIDATLTFKLDESGKCNELELFQGGIRQKAQRVE